MINSKFIALSLAVTVLIFGSISPASAQTAAPRVALQFATSGLASPLSSGSTNAAIARLILDTTGSSEAIRISSLPFNLIVGGGGGASILNNCQVYNEANPNNSLNSNNRVTMSSGLNPFTLDNQLVLNQNTITTLALRCDVASNMAIG